ncbi:MAG TPA: IclR family transcriptional regulator, partial [Streptosporangiaceae bacterium]|nr:IclR family transcriptional regulator [Streptosporangiaceae bacterium]
TSPNGTQAIDRAALLLTRVVQGTEPASFTELAAASGLAKSTTSRLLMALERHQLVRRDRDGRFCPGELFVRYAWQGTADSDLVAVAQPFLNQLGELTSETINLGIAANSGAGAAVNQIAQVDSKFMIGGTNWVGLAVPLHCSASGKVLLAFGSTHLPDEPYERRTKHTITTWSELDQELARVRERGYATTQEELETGLVAVAAPVFAGGRKAIAAISVSGPASRLAADQLETTAVHTVQVARKMSATLAGANLTEQRR